MSSPEHGELPRRPVPPPEAGSSPLTVGRPVHYVEFKTPAEPVSQPVGAFPALAAPKAHPRRRRRPRIVIAVPMWVILGVALLAVIAGLLFIPAITPWPPPPPLTPSDDTEPGAGVIGTGDPDPARDPDAGASPGNGGSPGVGGSRGPDATARVTPGADPTSGTPSATGSDAPPADVYVSYFSATPLLVVGYRVTVGISNRGSAPRNWEHIGVQVSGGVSLNMEVEEPETGVRVFSGSGRACLAPTTSEAARLDAGETLTIVFRIDALLSQTPGPAQTPDKDGCAPAES